MKQKRGISSIVVKCFITYSAVLSRVQWWPKENNWCVWSNFFVVVVISQTNVAVSPSTDYSFNILTLTSLLDMLLHSSFGEMVVCVVWRGAMFPLCLVCISQPQTKVRGPRNNWRLMEAVRKHLVGQAEPGSGPATIRKEKLYSNIPWRDVCQTVETRHWLQCRIKWWAGGLRSNFTK